MTARILSVVDCFDAVREDRQYRKAMTREQAIDLIINGSGTMYDPEVVRLFLAHLPRFEEEIRRQKKEVIASKSKVEGGLVARALRKDNCEAASNRVRDVRDEMTTLYEMAQTVGTSLDPRDMFAVFSSRLQDIVSYTTCVLYLRKANSIDIEAMHVSGSNAECFKGASIILGSGVTGWVVANRQPMYNCNPLLDFNAAQIELDTAYHTVIAVPLLKDDEVLGALTLYSATLNTYQPEHLRRVEAVAKLAADAMVSALHDEKVETGLLTDRLTGLANSRALRIRFEQEAERARRHGETFTLLMIDLDFFTTVNDTVDRDAGDNVLREVAGMLLLQMRAEDFLSRSSGNEFVALVRMGAREVRGLIERLQRTVENARFGAARLGAARMSVGWACFSADGESIDELALAADRAMYADKLRRKDIVSIAEDLKQAPVDHCRAI
jgi:diguanylate cyclase (GGDEF)-like protein